MPGLPFSRYTRALSSSVALLALAAAAGPADAAPVAGSPKKPALIAAASCYPPCVQDLRAMCTPVAPCTQNVPGTFETQGIGAYCYANGVKLATTQYTQTRLKADGTTCYSVEQPPVSSGTVTTLTWKNAAGTAVATETYDYQTLGGLIHTVTCGGTSYTIDLSSADCQAETAQQNPDVVCTADPTCQAIASGAGGGPGAGGSGVGGAGGAGGASSAPGTAGAPGAGGVPVSCTADQVLCNGTCANLMADRNNCGQCGLACSTSYSCMQGACTSVQTCPSGQVRCNGACVDPSNNAANCGACGHACAVGQVCFPDAVQGGICTASCGANMLMCGQDCKSAASSTTCGACGTDCGATSICCQTDITNTCADSATAPPSAFSCRACEVGWSSCDNHCVNLSNDVTHCGLCNVACQGKCEDGKCTAAQNHGCAVGSGSDTGYGLAGLTLFLASIGVFRRLRKRR